MTASAAKSSCDCVEGTLGHDSSPWTAPAALRETTRHSGRPSPSTCGSPIATARRWPATATSASSNPPRRSRRSRGPTHPLQTRGSGWRRKRHRPRRSASSSARIGPTIAGHAMQSWPRPTWILASEMHSPNASVTNDRSCRDLHTCLPGFFRFRAAPTLARRRASDASLSALPAGR
jgi:hypothetical protein